MNKTQKSAVLSLVMFLFCAVVITYAFLTMFVITPKESPVWTLLLPFGIILVTSIFWVRKKQSPTEVDFDERDDIIKKRAVIAGFVSVWVLLAIESVIPQKSPAPEPETKYSFDFQHLNVTLIQTYKRF